MKTPIEKWRQDLADSLRILKWGWHMKRWSTPLKTREANLNNMWYLPLLPVRMVKMKSYDNIADENAWYNLSAEDFSYA